MYIIGYFENNAFTTSNVPVHMYNEIADCGL